MASGASYVYILSELPKMINSGEFLKAGNFQIWVVQCYQTGQF